jgi:hypothetical protein
MKSDNKSLANDLSAAILSQLHGLNEKSAKKLIKLVDEVSKDIVRKFAKLKKEEADDKEKDAKKAAKKAAEKSTKIAKAKEKAAKKAALASKIAIVMDDEKPAPKVASAAPKPKPAAPAKKAPVKKPVAKKAPAAKPSAVAPNANEESGD